MVLRYDFKSAARRLPACLLRLYGTNPHSRGEHPAERSAIESLVEKCLAARGENCGAWESEINDRIYRIYRLTKDEIKLVEGAAK